jgi:hypothetical protein
VEGCVLPQKEYVTLLRLTATIVETEYVYFASSLFANVLNALIVMSIYCRHKYSEFRCLYAEGACELSESSLLYVLSTLTY